MLTENDDGRGGSSSPSVLTSCDDNFVAVPADDEGFFFGFTLTGSHPNDTSQSCGVGRVWKLSQIYTEF